MSTHALVIDRLLDLFIQRADLWDNGSDPVAEQPIDGVAKSRVSELLRERNTTRACHGNTRGCVGSRLSHAPLPGSGRGHRAGRSDIYLRPAWRRADDDAAYLQKEQRAALSAMLATLEPEALALSDAVVSLIPPRPPQSGVSRELFPRHTGYVFDPMAAAGTAAKITLHS